VVGWGDDNIVPVGLSNVFALSARDLSRLALIGSGPTATVVRISDYKWTTGGFSLSVPSQSGRVYALEYKSSLGDAWTALPLVPGTGTILTLSDT
jgi:hypothetical protein